MSDIKGCGTYKGYNRGCRCPKCAAAYSAYMKAYNAGKRILLDAAPARECLIRLEKNRGIKVRQLIGQVSCSDFTLYAIRNGTQKRIRRALLREILALESRIIKIDPKKRMSTAPLGQLALAVRLKGYGLNDISIEAGYSEPYFGQVLRRDGVTPVTFKRFYDAIVRMRSWPESNKKYAKLLKHYAFLAADQYEESA